MSQRYVDKLPLYLKRNLLKQYLTSYGNIYVTFENQILDFWRHLDPARIKADNYDPKYSTVLTQIGMWFGYAREFGVDGLSVMLEDHHLERLIRTKLWSIGYDGTREVLESNVKRIFGTEMKLVIQTVQSDHAFVNVLLIRSSSLIWDSVDDLLWSNEYYINASVGISYELTAITDDTLIYDTGAEYDSELKYDGEVI